MLTEVSVQGFTGLPYLEGSQLMQSHGGKVRFSKTKPNVIVGPNGAGKSALLTTLAIRFLAFFTGQSTFDEKYVTSTESKDWWTNAREWGHEYTYLKGLNCKTDEGPVLYYRPNHIPGNEDSVVAAMMTGYFDQAKAFARLTENKSSGQANLSVLQRVLDVLSGAETLTDYRNRDWRFGRKPRTLRYGDGFIGSYDHQAEVLKKLFASCAEAKPVLLLDEPEQSLDARAELLLWKAVEQADCSRLQVIVATHSLYPLMHPKKFNIIEATPGFAADVVSLLN